MGFPLLILFLEETISSEYLDIEPLDIHHNTVYGT